jgi:hypothetical protein
MSSTAITLRNHAHAYAPDDYIARILWLWSSALLRADLEFLKFFEIFDFIGIMSRLELLFVFYVSRSRSFSFSCSCSIALHVPQAGSETLP